MRWIIVLVVALAALAVWRGFLPTSAPFTQKELDEYEENWAIKQYKLATGGATLEPHMITGTKTCDGRYTYVSDGNFVNDNGLYQMLFGRGHWECLATKPKPDGLYTVYETFPPDYPGRENLWTVTK
jgi:hypothetical protein